MKQTNLLVEIPSSLKKEINKYLVEKAGDKSLQGSLKILVVQSIYGYLIERSKKIDSQASKDCMEVINKGRFDI